MIDVWLVDVGVLLDEHHPDYAAYSCAYDKKHGYYDEGQMYYAKEEEAVAFVCDYVSRGVENTYGIVSKTWIPEEALKDEKLEDICVEDESYKIEDVVFSIRKHENKLEEDFIERSAGS